MEQGACPGASAASWLAHPRALGGGEKGLKMHHWGHLRGLRKEPRSSIEDICSTTLDRGVVCIQTAAILQGTAGKKWVKSTQASAVQLFLSRPAVHASSGLIRALGSLPQSFKTPV